MRLINTETLLFAEFYSDIPLYAILSHRWEEEEVTFGDYPAQLAVLTSGGRCKKGFGKIELCAKQARLDGLSYCWVDTCCIDKSSSAELTEAINSMYAWYHGSAVCYVYLSDVDVSQKEHQDNKGKGPASHHADPLVQQVASSQWFTRGWTLQEFLAPAICILYDVQWVPVLRIDKPRGVEGNRYGGGPTPRWDVKRDVVRKVIEDVTGIDTDLMESFSPKSRDISVAMKMSWAAKRKTTRAEDTAYCLMGIFDVNMPLLYGEGGIKAFRRLQEEIIKQTDDHSIFYWRDLDADRSTFRGLLARSPVEFRDSYMPFVSRLPAYTRGDRGAHQTRTDKTYGMTNRGLRINLVMVSSGFTWSAKVMPGDDEQLALLELGRWDQQRYIVLARLSDDGHYARVDAHILPVIDTFDVGRTSERREVFVQQEPVVHYNYMSSRMTTIKMGSGWAFRIISTRPEEAWDAHRRQIRPEMFSQENPDVRFGVKRLLGLSDNNQPLASAVVHVADSFPLGAPSIDFTISLRWKRRREGEDDPYAINVQFDQVHYTDNPTHLQQHTGWKVDSKSIVWTSSSGMLRIRVREQALLDEDRLVLQADFILERRTGTSGVILGRIRPRRLVRSPWNSTLGVRLP